MTSRRQVIYSSAARGEVRTHAGSRLGIRNAMLNEPAEVSALRPQFATFLGVAGNRPDLVVRLGVLRSGAVTAATGASGAGVSQRSGDDALVD